MRLHYNEDDALSLNHQQYNTAENINVDYSDILCGCKDIKVNNYNCLFLTNSQQLTSNTTSKTQQVDSFTTFLKNDGKYLTTTLQATSSVAISIVPDDTYTEQTGIFRVILHKDGKLSISKYDCVYDITYNIDVFKLTGDANVSSIKYDYALNDNKLTVLNTAKSGAIDTLRKTFIIDELYNNISYVESTLTYDNVSGGVLSNNNSHLNSHLINIQYTSCDNDTYIPCNILNVSNNYTYTNNTITTNYWDTSNFYTTETIQTGTWQEKGSEYIYTTNSFFTYDIKITPGTNIIKTPETLYPYEQIDINDTMFVKNGAFGSTSPSISDRIYTNRDDKYVDNAIMLCTWLSSNDEGSVWVDRYYNPQLLAQTEASIIGGGDLIFKTIDAQRDLLKYGFFDKQSDLIIKPSQELTYYHVTLDDFSSYINQLDSTELSTIKCCKYNDLQLYTTNALTLSGDEYGSVNVITPINNNFSFAFTADMFEWNNSHFYELFSSQSNNCGIRIYKKNAITPILITWKVVDNNDNKYTYIKCLNTNFKVIDEIKLNGAARKIFRSNTLTYIVIEFDDRVCIYNIFGTLLHTFEGKFETINEIATNTGVKYKYIINRTKQSSYYENDIVYIAYKTHTEIFEIGGDGVEKFNSKTDIDEVITYDIYSSNELNSKTYNTNTIDKNLWCSEMKMWMSNQLPIKSAIVDGYGLFTLYASEENAINSAGSIMLNIGTEDTNIVSNNNINYITVHASKYVDPALNLPDYEQRNILDFAIYGDKLYYVTDSYLFVSEVNRNSFTKYLLPEHKNDKVNVVCTCEINDHQYVNNVYVLMSDKQQSDIGVYRFKEGKFIHINNVSLPDCNLYQFTPAYIPAYQTDLFFNIQFKLNDNKVIKYENMLPAIAPGKHTFFINVDNMLGIAKLYIDDACVVELIFDKNYTPQYNILQNQIILGNTLLYNGETLSTYINNSDYLLDNIQFSNLRIFTETVNDTIVKINKLLSTDTPTITFILPCGQRSNINKLNKLYKHSIPGYKSTNFDVIVKNLKLSTHNQQILSDLIKEYIKQYTPVITTLDEVLFKNY